MSIISWLKTSNSSYALLHLTYQEKVRSDMNIQYSILEIITYLQLKPQKLMYDKYDYLILDLIHMYKQNNQQYIKLGILERDFWLKIENDSDLNVGQARIGERIANLYVDGLIQNKDGYMLTKRGREELLGLEVN